MRPLVFLFLVSCLLAVDATAQRGSRRSRGPTPDLAHCEFKIEKIVAPSIRSDYAEYGIYVPKGYGDEKNAQRRYPLALWLHGMNESLRRFRSEGAEVYDGLLKQRKIPEMILVTPSAGRRPVYMNGARSGDQEDLILVDVLSHVEKNYRVMKGRHARALMGVSMGAMAAMKMALRHSDAFGSVAVHSSPVLPADPAEMSGRFKRYGTMLGIDEIFGEPIDKKKWAQEIPAALVASAKRGAFDGLRIYFDAGSADRYQFGPPNAQLSKAMKKRGIEHTFRYVKGGGHSWRSGAIQKAMVHSLQFVAQGFANPDTNSKTKKTPGGRAKKR